MADGGGKALALFIHGFDSSPAIWDPLASHLSADPAIAAGYNFARFQYATGKLPTADLLALGVIAETLETDLATTYGDYTQIALIAHSQGGLIAMRALCNLLAANQRLAVTRLLMYASPILGTAWASNPFAAGHPHIAPLATDSDFLMTLNRDAARLGLAGHIHIRRVSATRDRWVSRTSATAADFAAHPETVEGDHVEIVRPSSAGDPAALIARGFLIDPPPPPGAGDVERTAPILRDNTWALTAENRFVYGARKVPFYGRDGEMAALGEFCAGDAPLAWVLVHGSGGTGKSRLALELILRLREAGMHAGFLPAAGDRTAQPDWARWQPLLATVMVVDYAARESQAVAGMLRALAARRAGEGVGALGAPVRVILVEQAAGNPWLDGIMPSGNAGVGVKGAFAGRLALEPIQDVGPIFVAYLGEQRLSKLDSGQIVAKLAEIDPQGRPLFAALLADALDANWADIKAGKPIAGITDRAGLLGDTLRRWRENVWRPAGATPADERLLAVATMAGGFDVAQVQALANPGGQLAGLIEPWNVDRHPGAFAAMTGRPSGEGPGRLEPDIVGEFHALQVLEGDDLGASNRARLRDAAWQAAPRQMLDFALRCHRNWPEHPGTRGLRAAPALPADAPGLAAWALLAVGLTNEVDGKGRNLLDLAEAGAFIAGVKAVAGARAGQPGVEAIWTEWAKGAFNLLNDLAQAPETRNEARELHRDLRTIAEARAGEPGVEAIWERWAKGAFNLLAGLAQAPETRNEARSLHEDLRAVAEARAGQPGVEAIWELWAQGAVNLAATFGEARDMAALRALLRAVAECAPGRMEGILPVAFERVLRETLVAIAHHEGAAAVAAFANRAVASGAVPRAIAGAAAFALWALEDNEAAMEAQLEAWARDAPDLLAEVVAVGQAMQAALGGGRGGAS